MIGDSRTERLAPTTLTEWSAQQNVLQGREAWETSRDWIDLVNPRFAMYVSEGYIAGRSITDADVEAARSARGEIVSRVEQVLVNGTFVCLPTTASPAPLKGERLSARQEFRSRNAALTCIGGTLGAPQISLPLGEVDGLPVGRSSVRRVATSC